jgi:adenosylmethionine-8-amino-7-oxononanoate aminotransferase
MPPVAVSAHGIYVTLSDGREIIDGCGGAAVACIGQGHSAVQKAIGEQADKLSCKVPDIWYANIFADIPIRCVQHAVLQ